MNHPERQESSSDWDSLYSELGLEPPPRPAPALPAGPKHEALPPAPVHQERVHEEEPAEPRGGRGSRRRREPEEAEEPEGRAEPQRHFEEAREHHEADEGEAPDLPDEDEGGFLPAPEEFVAEVDVEEVVGLSSPEEVAETDEPGEEAGEGAAAGEAPPERTGRRRRRRRRRKGGAESAGAPSAEPASDAAEPETEFAAAERAEDDDSFHSEAPGELPDDEDGEQKPAVPAALDEELEAEEEDEPLPEWNVVSWTELIATLHRPER